MERFSNSMGKKICYGGLCNGRVSINNPLGEMWSTAILELEIVPPNGANIVWEWHLWDHLVQDSDPSLPGYGVVQSIQS